MSIDEFVFRVLSNGEVVVVQDGDMMALHSAQMAEFIVGNNSPGDGGPSWVAAIVNAVGNSSCGYWNNITKYLVVVGFLQLLALAGQAFLFLRQARIMGQHRASLEDLAEAARDNAIAASPR